MNGGVGGLKWNHLNLFRCKLWQIGIREIPVYSRVRTPSATQVLALKRCYNAIPTFARRWALFHIFLYFPTLVVAALSTVSEAHLNISCAYERPIWQLPRRSPYGGKLQHVSNGYARLRSQDVVVRWWSGGSWCWELDRKIELDRPACMTDSPVCSRMSVPLEEAG